MAVAQQEITENYALYNGDCVEVLPSMPDRSIHLSLYSPPFCGLYNYSSGDRDMSNCTSYEGFLEHYAFLVEQIARVTLPGRMTVVHCMDIPNPGQRTGYYDFPGKVIEIHERAGFFYFGRIAIWKEPLRVAIRTRLKHLQHKQLVKDSCQSTIAAGDFLLVLKRKGENTIPVAHPVGLSQYAGETEVPRELMKFKGGTVQEKNRLSQWIWRRYASCVWDDIRAQRILPFKEAREPDDEKHVHPLQLDVVDRCIQLWSNPGEAVLTPFMGVGSEVYGAVAAGRKGVGIELKASYYKQARRHIAQALLDKPINSGLIG